MKFVDLNKRAAEVHKNNEKWWVDLNTLERIDRNKGEMLMLVLTELAEAAEGERKNLMDDHLPHRKMAEVEMADAYIRMLDFAGGFGYNIESEVIYSIYESDKNSLIANFELPTNRLESLFEVSKTVINLGFALEFQDEENAEEAVSSVIFSILAYCWQFDYDIEGAFQEKNEYNKTRKDHSIEERRKENGKKV